MVSSRPSLVLPDTFLMPAALFAAVSALPVAIWLPVGFGLLRTVPGCHFMGLR